MMQHDFDMMCWCGPILDTTVCDDGHPNEVIFHHDENGDDLFFVAPGEDTPYCADCGEVMPEFLPELPWIWRSRSFLSLMHDDLFEVGVTARRVEEGPLDITIGLGWRRLHLSIFGERRGQSPAETASEMAPHMLAEIEQHLRSHHG